MRPTDEHRPRRSPDRNARASRSTAARRALVLAAGVLAGVHAGCQSGGGGGGDVAGRPHSAIDAAPADRSTAGAPGVTDPLMAMVDGAPLRWSSLRPALIEAAGAEVLRDRVLDAAIAEELELRGLRITSADVDAERELLLRSLSSDRAVALRLLERIRVEQRLGDDRYRAMLRRNAAMRRLVRDEVVVTEDDLRRQHAMVHGERRQARLVTTGDLTAARAVIAELDAGAPFAQVAAVRSTDVSADRGGLLEPIARTDPAYPEAVRTALFDIELGERTAPILVEQGYAILRLERIIPATGRSLDSTRDEMTELVRTARERVRMDRLARALLLDTDLRILDPDLEAAWRRRSEPGSPLGG